MRSKSLFNEIVNQAPNTDWGLIDTLVDSLVESTDHHNQRRPVPIPRLGVFGSELIGSFAEDEVFRSTIAKLRELGVKVDFEPGQASLIVGDIELWATGAISIND